MKFAAVLALALVAAGAAAQEDQAPEFGVMEGAKLTHFLTRSFDAYSLPVGKFTRDEKPVRTLEGAVREFVYELDDETSTLEAIRNYQRSFGDLGYATLFECAGETCGGFDFRFGIYLVEPPAMRFDLADFRYLALVDETAGRNASVLASRQGGKLFIQVIAVEGQAAPATMVDVADAPKPRAKPQEARLYALARLLTEEGHAPLDGIEFEAGSAKLIGRSEDTLSQAATLLRGRPDLTFLVVGHTDNQGDLELNLKLSRARAEAVAARLAAEEGVEAAQLVPHGVGFLAPRATNATEEGRALNRRVELVVK